MNSREYEGFELLVRKGYSTHDCLTIAHQSGDNSSTEKNYSHDMQVLNNYYVPYFLLSSL